MRLISITTLLALLTSPVLAQAKPSLWTYPNIEVGLIEIGTAHGIQEACPRIAPNRIRGLLFANSLRNFALKEGYSSDAITTFVRSDVEREVLREKVIKRLQQQGVNHEDSAQMCEAGQAEIARKSNIGRMLRKLNTP